MGLRQLRVYYLKPFLDIFFSLHTEITHNQFNYIFTNQKSLLVNGELHGKFSVLLLCDNELHFHDVVTQ